MEQLKKKAKKLRKQLIDLSLEIGETHLGGCFSEIEIMITLYDLILKEEDKFILSKGHCCHAMYLLLKERGYNPKISPHPDIDIENKIFCTTGSLGHGFPIAVGMALARKKMNAKGKIFVLMGDGECQEGTTWESAMIANYRKLDNLILIVDRNKLQALDKIDDALSVGDLRKKFEVFGWSAIEVNGHSFEELIEGFKKLDNDKPKVIIAHTVKGKGISFMENDTKWHARVPNKEELKQAYEELK